MQLSKERSWRAFMRLHGLLVGTLMLLQGCAALPYPDRPGNIFVRLEVFDISAWTKGFLSEAPTLKSQGFTAYSLHQDLKDPHALILTLKCSDLKKGVRYVAGGNLMDLPTAVGKAHFWAGVDVLGRAYDGKVGKAPAGIVIVRHQVKDFDFWYQSFTHVTGGTHHHPNRGYVPSDRSIHRVPGKPEAALVVHEASDVRKAPAFMEDPNMKDRMEAAGVLGKPEVWYGLNLQEGTF